MSTYGEEIANGATHAVGTLLSIAGLVVVAARAPAGDGWRLGSGLAFGIALVMLYASSSLYHFSTAPRAKHVFKVLDHASIYVLIAATYTPYALVTLRHSGGLWLFVPLWVLTLIGVVAEAAWVHRPRWLSASVYLVMGWLGAFATGPLLAHLPHGGLWLLFVGGLAYTFGTIFYVLQRVPYMHAVWHLFVIAGSVCHFLSVTLYVIS